MTSIHRSRPILRLPVGLLLLLLQLQAPLGWAQPSSNSGGSEADDTDIGSSVCVVLLVIICLVVCLCGRDCFRLVEPPGGPTGLLPGPTCPSSLDRGLINTFPIVKYSFDRRQRLLKGVLECAVCLKEFEDHEVLRVIPRCCHVFHPECIDAWLSSNTTCPLCRSNLAEFLGNGRSTR